MQPIPRHQRIFYGVILVAAAVVAVGGLLAPGVLADVFSWFVLPPLHARFLGAIYLFGAVFMLCCILARTQAEVRSALPLVAIFTGTLFLVSILNLRAFDFSRTSVLVWFASYVVYPVLALVLFARLVLTSREPAGGPGSVAADAPAPRGDALPEWARAFLLVQGIVVTVLAAALFLMPVIVAASWPWAVDPFLARAYSGPLLAYGIGSLVASRNRTWVEVWTIVPGMLAFTVATLIASALHPNLFSATDAIDIVWFASFGIATAVLAVMTVRAIPHARRPPARSV